ncbi:hypothetical protein P0W64_13410 [Tsukamurella sp. 8F]|uniref:hypothetical protein n=1 Tax=unclassified Tsukamurella TaxID=2633480 RepID=UPI0023B93A6C|nr:MULTISPECIES: hypothetical protein [unclassified Tsukamurella]MDF0530409.1 hypothetical protein [Tsukamurella sp. 8J]MDF0587770.1 hypothetical protein [Tsukamurella sp. 8F]
MHTLLIDLLRIAEYGAQVLAAGAVVVPIGFLLAEIDRRRHGRKWRWRRRFEPEYSGSVDVGPTNIDGGVGGSWN